ERGGARARQGELPQESGPAGPRLRRLPHDRERARRRQVSGRTPARQRAERAHPALPDMAHQPGGRVGHAQADAVVHDSARNEHARGRRRGVRRAGALPHVLRSGQADERARHPPLTKGEWRRWCPAAAGPVVAHGNVTLLHMTEPHGTLLPVHYREPDMRIGVGDEAGKPPFVSGEAFLKAYGIARGSAEAYALTHLDFPVLAARYGRMGGYAHLATLVKRVREERNRKTLLLDWGDTLQGSVAALWTRGEDMVRAMNQLGVEVFTPHWEFT